MAPSVYVESGKQGEAGSESDRLGSPIPPLRVELSGTNKKMILPLWSVLLWFGVCLTDLVLCNSYHQTRPMSSRCCVADCKSF